MHRESAAEKRGGFRVVVIHQVARPAFKDFDVLQAALDFAQKQSQKSGTRDATVFCYHEGKVSKVAFFVNGKSMEIFSPQGR